MGVVDSGGGGGGNVGGNERSDGGGEGYRHDDGMYQGNGVQGVMSLLRQGNELESVNQSHTYTKRGAWWLLWWKEMNGDG